MIKEKGIYLIPKDKKEFTLYYSDGDKFTKLYENSYAQELVDYTEIDFLAVTVVLGYLEEDTVINVVNQFKKFDFVIGNLLDIEIENLPDSAGFEEIEKVFIKFFDSFRDTRFTVRYYADFKSEDEKVADKIKRIYELDHWFINTTFNEFFYYDFEDDDAISDSMTHGYYFDNLSNYFDFLLYQLLRVNPNICKCFNCDGFFVAKINRRTSYCDRVITEDGKTCKQVGAKEREKLMLYNVSGYQQYKQAVDRNYRRVSRAEKSTSYREKPKALDYETYSEWQKRAKKAFDDFQEDLISTDEFLEILNELE